MHTFSVPSPAPSPALSLPPASRNSQIDPQLLHCLHETRYRSFLKYESGKVQILEIDYRYNPQHQPPRIQNHRLSPKEFEDYLEQIDHRAEAEANKSEITRGKLRLIQANKSTPNCLLLLSLGRAPVKPISPKSVPLEFPRDLDNVGSSGLGAFSRQHHTALPVPFSQLHYDMMLHKFGLPKSTSLALKTFDISSNSSFQLSEIESCWEPSGEDDSKDPVKQGCPKRVGITMACLSSTLIEFEMGLSMAYCPRSNTTNAWLFGRHTTRHAALVERDITFLAEMADHPLFLPYLLCTYLKSSIDRQIYTSTEKLFLVEAESGQSGIVLVGRNGVMPRGNCDDPELSKRATGISQLAISLNIYCQGLLLNIEGILQAFPKMEAVVPDLSCRRLVALQQSKTLQERLCHLDQKARFSILRITHLRERATVQSSAIYNHLAHRANEINVGLAESSRIIAIDAKRDSSSMKSIAILTMIFLPGTYIATLFATPGIQELGPTMAVYWLVTIPITGFTLFFWFGWNWLSFQHINLPGVMTFVNRKHSNSSHSTTTPFSTRSHLRGSHYGSLGRNFTLGSAFTFFNRKTTGNFSLPTRSTLAPSVASPTATLSP
ncbi:hypothetical protein MKZ38_009496 [Zalerion maritima]|uniref:Uncharacterized protein n=1 Tax=Zalerion maritima TaxID=339359 RepID=A0AAD5WUM7_9PEZI|nr:hypothetical protein MKZ38_009496 [Zalerion maritima]